MSQQKTIAVIGGTGALGQGLALRWARAGLPVIIGSRERHKAEDAARQGNEKLQLDTIRGMANVEAARSADMVAIAVPFSQHASILEALREAVQGKIVIDATVPLNPPKVKTVNLPAGGSAAKAAQEFLGPDARVISAFQNVAAAHLQDLDHHIDCDILVCGNDPEARQEVIDLVEAAGMRGWEAGRIENSVIAEALTSGLIFINGKYKLEGAGIRITFKGKAG